MNVNPEAPRAARIPADRVLLALACLAFVSLGLPDAAGGVAWPSVRSEFSLAEGSLGWILVAVGSGYALSSFLAGKLVASIGIGALLVISTGLMAISLTGYAFAPFWSIFLGCAVLAGLGSGAIDAGLNSFGAKHFSAGRMNWLHACYGVGAMLGPMLMTGALTWARSWRLGYGVVAGLQAVMTVMFIATRRLWERPFASVHGKQTKAVGIREAIAHPVVRLQMAVFFLYTGFEATVGQWSFTLLSESRGVAVPTAGVWVGIYWSSLMTGRVVWGFVVDRVSVDRLLRVCVLTALGGASLLTVRSPEFLSLAALACIGFGLAPVFPCLMNRTPSRLGAALALHAVGFQVTSAMLGWIIIPSAVGLLVNKFGVEIVGVCAVILAVSLCGLHEALVRRT